ncbi:MAG: Gfo/Idh/MocA family oxidoreductase [Victivallaceae bacterium]|nr:Gfo/Idh/MocA family oxidoreductase [Victivallaceae bacterium]
MKKKTYVQVGTGSRAGMYLEALCGDFSDVGTIAALCDTNQTRMDYWNDQLVEKFHIAKLPTYKAADFDRMIEEIKPDTVIVTSMDRTHHKYICRAMELGCDVITEKPMTIDVEKCRQIIETKNRTGKHVTVTFNYRYSPRNTKVKEILESGIVGEITSIHFEWLLDVSHGADYFRRWHRNKNNSGGLLVHKATHHFDLVNWWINSWPKTVFAMGDLKFYGKENAERRGVTEFYSRARNSQIAAKDPFALKVEAGDTLDKLYYAAEHEDGYFRDQSVFGDGISIEDNMGVMIRYHNNTVMTYSLNAHCPWEGYRVCFNGTKGRLEFNVVERTYVSADGQEDFSRPGMRELENDKSKMVPEIIFQKQFGKPQVISYDENDKAGHGGGDTRLLNDVLRGAGNDPLGHAAGYVDGAKSILAGISANLSIKTGLPVDVDSLVDLR